MFETQLPMLVKAVKVKLDANDGAPIRVCTLTLAAEFDATIAGALGEEAREARQALRSGGMTSCVLPIDSLLVEGRLVADSATHTIKNLKGVKATAKAGDEDQPPRIELEFGFLFDRETWAFVGEHIGVMAAVTFRHMQMELVAGGRGKRRAVEA